MRSLICLKLLILRSYSITNQSNKRYEIKLKNSDYDMCITAPMNDFTDEFIGVIVLEVDIEEPIFQLIQDTIGLGDTGETLIGKNDKTIFLTSHRYDKNLSLNQDQTLCIHTNCWLYGTYTKTL